jgi:hypothetical protein
VIDLFSLLSLYSFLGLIKDVFSFISTGSTVQYQWLRMNAGLSQVISCEILDGGNSTRACFSSSFLHCLSFQYDCIHIYHRSLKCAIALSRQHIIRSSILKYGAPFMAGTALDI